MSEAGSLGSSCLESESKLKQMVFFLIFLILSLPLLFRHDSIKHNMKKDAV